MPRLTGVLASLALLGATAWLSHQAADAAPTLAPVVTSLTEPTYVAHAGDGTNRLFIVEQPGRIKVLQPGATTPTVFLDITSKVRSIGFEEGLFSVAFHPDFETNGFFYVYYTTNPAGDANLIARYTVSSDPNVADATSEVPVLLVPHPVFANHNGGQLQFGPDGFLYAGTGDGGSAGDPNNNGQNLGTLLGKVLRLDVDTGFPYAIPPSNPFVATPGARPEIWALGLRNPWRFSFDRLTGDLVTADVGQVTREELDFQPASSTGGENYCWRRFEGTFLFRADTPCVTGTPTAPILEYGHDQLGQNGERCSITGGYVYRGTAGTFTTGTYVFGDFCSGEIFLLQNGFASLLFDTTLDITSFGEDQAGEIYVVDQSGTVQRFVNSGAPEITVGLNRLLTYRTGEMLSVGLGARNSGPALSGDLYAGVILPDQLTIAFITGLSPLSVVLASSSASPADFPPLATGVIVPSGLDLPMSPILSYTFNGTEPDAAEPGPPYRFFVVFTQPGALLDGRIDPDDITLLTFQDFRFTP